MSIMDDPLNPERDPAPFAAVRPAPLLPHESWCPACGGIRPYGCAECDGVGYTVNDRRVEQPDVRKILEQLLAAHREPVIRALREAGEQIEARVAQVNQLERELAALRLIVREQRLLLDAAQPDEERLRDGRVAAAGMGSAVASSEAAVVPH